MIIRQCEPAIGQIDREGKTASRSEIPPIVCRPIPSKPVRWVSLRSTHPTRYSTSSILTPQPARTLSHAPSMRRRKRGSVIIVVIPISMGTQSPPAIAGPGSVRSAPTTVVAAPVAVMIRGAMRRNPTALPLVPITWDGMPAPTALSPHAHDSGCWARRGGSSLPFQRNSISGDGGRQTETRGQDQSYEAHLLSPVTQVLPPQTTVQRTAFVRRVRIAALGGPTSRPRPDDEFVA